MTQRRWFAIGDPQAPFERFIGILQGHDLLGAAGTLRDDVGLVSMGDHFDFDFRAHGVTLDTAGHHGTRILRWLADEHPPDQVVILMGNHDAARVMELAYESDASFAAARQLAASHPADFAAAFPRIPTPGIALRDYASFAVHQRELVQRLLVQRRMRLAVVGQRDGHAMLMTHAGVTTREVEGLGSADARSLAAALQRQLHEAVDRVAPAWERGEHAALDLRPLHVAGTTGQEGGGLLYHRVSREDDAGGRRFAPRSLPRGLVQVVGHTGHHKCKEHLDEAWLAEDAKALARGGLRTLAVDASGVHYTAHIAAPREDAATMYMIDIEMSRPEVTDLPLLELDAVEP